MSRTAAFWDTSALVPLCTTQHATMTAEALAAQYEMIVWWSAPVEIHSAIRRLSRAGQINSQEVRLALNLLSAIALRWREIVPSAELREHAANLLATYALRAADSLQLAAAMTWCRGKPLGRTFICSDIRLEEAAKLAGFTVLNPERTINPS